MAVTGWSYGGYMTTWLLGNYPGAGRRRSPAPRSPTGRPVQLGDANVRRGAALWAARPVGWTAARTTAKQSPITYADKIRAPTLILSDTGDYRVTMTQSYKLYHVLKDNGVETQFIAYPVGGHSPADPVRMRDVDRRWVAWLESHLQ